MTDVTKIKDIIKKRGIKIIFIADSLGISRQALSKKLSNKTSFNQYEIEKMCNILGIDSLEEKEAIFFASDVD